MKNSHGNLQPHRIRKITTHANDHVVNEYRKKSLKLQNDSLLFLFFLITRPVIPLLALALLSPRISARG